MIVCDLARALICVAFLLVGRDTLWLAYVLLPLLASFAAPFDPAFSAATPNVVEPDDLPAANALNGSLWGTMLAVGAGLGGTRQRCVRRRHGIPRRRRFLPGFRRAALVDPASLLRVGGRGHRAPRCDRGHQGDVALRTARPPGPFSARRQVRVRGCGRTPRTDPGDGDRRLRVRQRRLRHPHGGARSGRVDRAVPRPPDRGARDIAGSSPRSGCRSQCSASGTWRWGSHPRWRWRR